MSWEDHPEYGSNRRGFWFAFAALIILFFAAFLLPDRATAINYSESDIQACACKDMKREVRTSAGTFVDCVSDTHAIEVEGTQDWAEAIGQSLHYAAETRLAPKVLFFCEADQAACQRHVLRFESVATDLGIAFDYVPDSCLR